MSRTTVTATQIQATQPITAKGRTYQPDGHALERSGALHALCDDCEKSLVVNAINVTSIRDVPPETACFGTRGAMGRPQRICCEMLLLEIGTVIIPPEGVTLIGPTSTHAGRLRS